MFVRSFIGSAVVAFLAALIAGAVIVAGGDAGEGSTAEFATVAPSASVHTLPVGVLDVARAYAAEHGLTDCVAPAHARLDDVVLTVPRDPLGGKVVTPVGFDEALQSGSMGRWNVLACKAADSPA